jgi:hypothetical protein
MGNQRVKVSVEEEIESSKVKIGTIVPARAPFDPARWAVANPWLVEGQADDRTPVNGSVVSSAGSESAQRALARLSHQLMFKKWSKDRRD